MLNFNHVHYFHVVATEGSIVRAAEKLGLAQATVSEQIRQLERTLDTPLFERQPGGLKLTPAGRQAFAQTSIMFQAADRLLEEVSGRSRHPTSLRIGVSVSASRAVAAHFLTPILELEGSISIIRNGEAEELLRQLRANDLDLVLSEDERPSKDLSVTCIHRPTFVVVASAEEPTNPSTEWPALPLITYLPESPLRWEVDRLVRDRAPKTAVCAETDDVQFMVEAVARGLAIAIVPRSVARDAVDRKRIRIVEVVSASNISINAIFRDGSSHERVVRAVELLVSYARDRFDPQT
ncbi:LysR family hpxDE operon transcriptional regulator HpxR [soil metagenome]